MCVREEKWRETVYDRDRGRFYFYIVDLPFFTALNNFSHNSTSANGFAIAFTYGRTAASLEVELLLFFFDSLSDILTIIFFTLTDQGAVFQDIFHR